MSGICGVLAKRGEGLPTSASIEAMCRRLSLDTPEAHPVRTATASSGPVRLGAALFGRQSGGVASVEREGAVVSLVACGDVYEGARPNDAGWSAAADLLEKYLRDGIAFLDRLDGDVAVAIWDGRVDLLHVAVGRFRVHPIFYSDTPDQLVFASRLGALFDSPIPFHATLRPDAIVDTVGTSAIPTPKTVFREIAKLPAGYRLVCTKGATTLSRYWQADFLHPSRAGEPALAAELRSRFTEAIARPFKVDGSPDRVGTFLSGGVDSSTVTGILMQVAGRQMKSFSIGFGEHGYNEISYARIAARAMGAEHFEYFVVPKDVPEALPALLASFDEPYGNASSVPTHFCARLARQHGVDVLYAGDGGDELFGGNERYATQRLFEYYHAIPSWLGRGVVEPVVSALADSLRLDLFVKGKKYIRRANLPAAKRITSYDFFNVVPLEQFLSPDFLAEVGRGYDPGDTLARLHEEAPAKTELDRQLYLDLHLTISDNDLFKVTRMTEAAGVTVRFPFLDYRLAEFALTVPASLKMRGRELRTFFKRAYADLLPVEVRTKSKHGFGLPIAQWLQTDPVLRDMMDDLVLGPRALSRGYFRREAIEELVRVHRGDPTSFYGTTIWNLMILEMWQRQFEARGSQGAGVSRGPG
ncbi:MAG: asparagine synthetase B family protein [Candidatus Eiseniibacteriota bacterium]